MDNNWQQKEYRQMAEVKAVRQHHRMAVGDKVDGLRKGGAVKAKKESPAKKAMPFTKGKSPKKGC